MGVLRTKPPSKKSKRGKPRKQYPHSRGRLLFHMFPRFTEKDRDELEWMRTEWRNDAAHKARAEARRARR